MDYHECQIQLPQKAFKSSGTFENNIFLFPQVQWIQTRYTWTQYNAIKCQRFPQHTYCTFMDLIDHGRCPHSSTYLTILTLVKNWNHVEGQASI